MRSYDAPGAAALALGLGVALALIVDLGAPRGNEGKVATTASSAAVAAGLSDRMEAQIAAGAPGVALAIEDDAPADQRARASVSAAHAHALFELGDAPAALETVRRALASCTSSAVETERCTASDRMSLDRLDVVIGAIVDAGVVDPKQSPERVDRALHDLLPAAAFQR